MADGNGPVGFTVKEILTQIVIPDLKAIKTALDQKADRAEVVALEARMAHFEAAEGSYVKRAGPVMDQIRSHEARVEDLEKDAIRRDALVQRFIETEKQVKMNTAAVNGMPLAIRTSIDKALEGYDTRAQSQADRTFSRRDRVLIGALGIIGMVATVISTIFLVLSTHTGG